MPGFPGGGVGTPSHTTGYVPAVRHERNYVLSGLTVDINGAVLGSVLVKLFSTATDTLVAQTTSHPTLGTWSFIVDKTQQFYTVEYKAGPPDVFGSSPNTLAGV